MSRRKQLNPKAIKVDDSLAEESHITEEMSFTVHIDDQGGEDSEDDRLIISEVYHSPNNAQVSFHDDDDDDDEDDDDDDDGDGDAISNNNIQTTFFLDNIKLEPGSSSANNLLFVNHNYVLGQKTSKSRRKSDRILPLPTKDGCHNFKCPVCDDILISNHELTKHIRSHNSPSEITPTINSCKICGKILSSMSSLDRHMLVHSGERPFQCRICHMAFTTNGNMHRHMRIHAKDQDPLADQGFFKDGVVYKPPKKKRISEAFSDVPHKKMRNSYPLGDGDFVGLKLHDDVSNQILSPELYKCITQTIQQPHEETFEINPLKGGYYCKLCDEYLYSLYGFMEHLSDHNFHSNLNDSWISYKCLPCNCKFKTLEELETHLVGEHPASAVGLNVDASNKRILSDKLKVEFSNSQMDSINKYETSTFEITSNKFLLASGGDKSEIDKNNNTNDFLVSISNPMNTLEDDPNADVLVPLSSLSLHKSSSELTSALVSFCPRCHGMSFLSLEERKVHELLCHMTKEIMSGWCTRSFDDPRGNIDQREFMLILGLNSNSRKMIQCKNGLKFVDHTGIIPTPVILEMECKNELLDYHKGIQFLPFISPQPPLHISPPLSSDNQPLYGCTECLFTCTNGVVLCKHERIHKTERFYKCLKCLQPFSTKANCERHLRKKHSLLMRQDVEKFSQLVKSNPDDHPTSNSPRLMETICKYCGEDFKVERALKHHLRSQSSCQHKPYTCQVCSTGFSTKANCLRHIQKQHPDLQPYEVHMKVNLDLIEAQKKINRSPMIVIGEKERKNSGRNFEIKRSIQSSSSQSVKEIPKNQLDCGGILDLRQTNVIETSFDEPLDFSLKKDEANINFESEVGRSEESPVDLSLRRPSKQAILSGNSNVKLPSHKSTFVSLKSILKPSIIPNNLKHYNPRTNMFHCPICAAIFKQSEKLQSHLPTHSLAPSSSDTSSSSSSSPSSSSVSSSLLTSPKLSSAYTQFHLPRRVEQQDCCMDDKIIRNNNNNNTIFKNANMPHFDVVHDSDLASITSVVSSLSSLPFQTSSIPQFIPSFMMKSPKSNKPTINKERLNEKRVRPGSFQRLKLNLLGGRRNSYSDSPHKLKCHFCPRAFPWISSLKRHLLTHTGHKPYKCLKCLVTFSTKSNRERHMMRKHGINIRGQTFEQFDQIYTCHLCESEPFASLDMLLGHHREFHAHPVYDIPRPLIIEPQEDEGEEFEEVECGADDLNDNFIQMTSNTENDDEELQRDTTTTLMNSNTLLDVFVSRTKSIPVIPIACPIANPILKNSLHVNPERDNYNVDKITRCWKCDQSFDCRKGLLRHLKEHNVDLPFKCYLCDASYNSRIDSLSHKISAHPQDWSSVKEKNKVGDDVMKYSDFMERIVEETLSGNLQGRITSSDGGFDLDLRPETDYAQRKVFCTLCPKRFWSLQDLRRHMRSHTGERPFECDVCRARFTLKHSMMRHRRKHQSSAVSPSNIFQNVLDDNNITIFNNNNNIDDFNLLDELEGEGNYMEVESYEDHSMEEMNVNDDHINNNNLYEDDENYDLVIDEDVEHSI